MFAREGGGGALRGLSGAGLQVEHNLRGGAALDWLAVDVQVEHLRVCTHAGGRRGKTLGCVARLPVADSHELRARINETFHA